MAGGDRENQDEPFRRTWKGNLGKIISLVEKDQTETRTSLLHCRFQF